MRTKSMHIYERSGKGGEQYIFVVTPDDVRQAFEKIENKWVRVELKTALLNVGVPGTRDDHTHTLFRHLTLS